jgi:dTDP-4-amino-4,6-dideoxygalactose transaminase
VIPVALPLLADEKADAARAEVPPGWVSQGLQVAAFERDFAALVGAPYGCPAPAQAHHEHRYDGGLKDVPKFDPFWPG